jgi:hypothetical protein
MGSFEKFDFPTWEWGGTRRQNPGFFLIGPLRVYL